MGVLCLAHVITFQVYLMSHPRRARGCEVALLPTMLSKVNIPTLGLILVRVCPFDSSPVVKSFLVKILH